MTDVTAQNHQPTSATAGRPSKLTPAIHDAIIRDIQAGNYLETVAKKHGLAKQTIYDWLQKGAQRGGKYRRFLDAFARAAGEAETDALVRVMAGGKDWQSVAWFLERRYPDRWGRRDVTAIDLKIQNMANLPQSEQLELVAAATLTLNPNAIDTP